MEAGVGIAILPESSARRHQRTMKLAVIEIDEPWVVRERSILVRDLEALPNVIRALVGVLQEYGERNI
ncbi:LysR substrate binding domain protein [compost metagenome]